MEKILENKLIRQVLYFHYLIKYRLTHEKGCYPVCYNEWVDNELKEGFWW